MHKLLWGCLIVASFSNVMSSHAEQKDSLLLMVPPILASLVTPVAPPPVTQQPTYFPRESIWYQDVSTAGVDARSDSVINWLAAEGGWGNGDVFQIDFSMKILQLKATVAKKDFIETDDFYTPDCDHVMIPLPDGGSIEGNSGYVCEDDGDCHLIVADWEEKILYEMWRANISGGKFYGGCLAVWDMTRNYPPTGRGDQCTSADAAG